MENRISLITAFILVVCGLCYIFLKPLVFPKNQQSVSANVSMPVASIDNPQVFDIVIAGNKINVGSSTFNITQGNTVFINIVSDKDQDLIMQGYNKTIALEKNKNVTLQFVATQSGQFPLILENTQTKVGTLNIQP